MSAKQIELRNEIYNCTVAIKAFKMGMKHFAPDGLDEAPSIEWLRMQKRICINHLDKMREEAAK